MIWIGILLLLLGRVPPAFGEAADPKKFEECRAVVIGVDSADDALKQVVTVRITSGIYSGREAKAQYERNAFFSDKYVLDPIQVGQRVILHVEKDRYGGISIAYVSGHERDLPMLWLFGLFCLVLLVVGRSKGIKAILSLLVTVLAILFFLLPMILKGYNPVMLSILTCIFVVCVSLLIISGFNRKTVAAIIGTIGGVITAGVLFLIFSNLMHITGIMDEQANLLLYIPQQIAIDFKGLLFAGILVASMGASMDIGIAVASSINEVRENSPGIGHKALFRAGMNVGKDAMATMTNTLILAYTGTSINLMLLLIAHERPFINFMNWEIIGIEVTRALTATIGLVAAIPLTAFVAAQLFGSGAAPKKGDADHSKDVNLDPRMNRKSAHPTNE